MPEASSIPKLKTLLNIAEKAFKEVFKNKNYSVKDLFNKKEYQALAKQTIDIYESAFPDTITDEMRLYLEKDVFVFSQLKTHTQLAQARSLLKDEKGNLREWASFKDEILKLNNTYNKNYLQAEYTFAVQSSLSASQWAEWNNDSENFWLEYQTMGDELVRDSHQALNGIKLPKNDPFWEKFYPPNGWRCRCDVLKTSAEDKPPISSKKAIAKGMNATDQTNGNGVNKLAMFRFNPGMQKKVFPPNNSYRPKYCSTSKKPQGLLPFASLEDERCKALEEIEKRAKIQLELNKLKAPLKIYYKAKNGAKVRVSPFADPTDYNTNFKIAKLIADKIGDSVDIRPHLYLKGYKNPEYEIDGIKGDRTSIDGNIKNFVGNSFGNKLKKGKQLYGLKQTFLVLDCKEIMKLSTKSFKAFSSDVYNRMTNHKTVKELYIVYNKKVIVINQNDVKKGLSNVKKILKPIKTQ